MPNHCSSSNKSFYKLLWYCCTCNALRVLRFATQFVMLLAVPPHSSRQLLCPSRNFVHFFLVTLHYTTFAARQFASVPGILPLTHKSAMAGCTVPYASQRYNTHWVSLRFTRHSFTSVSFSPPAALFYFARRQPHLRLRSPCDC